MSSFIHEKKKVMEVSYDDGRLNTIVHSKLLTTQMMSKKKTGMALSGSIPPSVQTSIQSLVIKLNSPF